jgi:uncharacterized membrane protein
VTSVTKTFTLKGLRPNPSVSLPVVNKSKNDIILPVVLYGYKTYSLILWEQHRLRVFENKVLKRIFGPKRDEVTREWRELHNEELRDLYSSLENEVGGACSQNGGKEKCV